jgi:amphi-Trp domain-containing protein
MPEEILFEHESHQSRPDVATYLRSLADKLDAGDAVTLKAGADELRLDVPQTVEFEVKAERETGGGSPELSIEVELEWTEGQDTPAQGDLEIA